VKWIICFCDSPNIGMWKLFTKGKKGFSHVFAIRYDTKNDIWTKYEFSTHGFRFEPYKGKEADILFANMMNYWTCLDVVVEDKPIYMPRLMYCVSFVKHIVGISKFWVMSPYQLYCELLKNGAKPMFEEQGDKNG
jgi:hypothetical protein